MSRNTSINRLARGGPDGGVLGLECGGTRSTAAFADSSGALLSTRDFGPANLRLLSDDALVRHFRVIARAFPQPKAVGIGMAGARTSADRYRIRTAAQQVWPATPCTATSDLEIALAADSRHANETRVLVLSGTGSCCFGQAPDGRTAKIGGWGHLLGDKGSGYDIGLRALKAAVFYLDRDGAWTTLGQRIIAALQLNEPNDLIDWVQGATKTEIAALTIEVFAAAQSGDRIARDVLVGAAATLASDAVACSARLARRGMHVRFFLAGSILICQPAFARKVAREIRALRRKAVVSNLTTPGVMGAIEMARREAGTLEPYGRKKFGPSRSFRLSKVEGSRPGSVQVSAPIRPQATLSPTEARHPRSTHLDRMPVSRAIDLMLDEDSGLPGVIRQEKVKIARVIGWTVRAFRHRGRLIYVGAGTSGRLGILDASECPPTFRTSPQMVQGIIAGGPRAITSAVERAEDDAGAGATAIAFRRVMRHDVVVGIAASGRTPFVLGALDEARRRGARTALICFNPGVRATLREGPEVVIAPAIGPELLTGSTRLKAGTATKLILNMLTTLAMVRIGKVMGNLMVDLNPSNTKLRARAVRIVRELTGTDEDAATRALHDSGWTVRRAVEQLRRRGKESGGRVRR